MAKLLAVDLDGTLFHPKRIKKCIPKKNVLFLRRWIDAGNKVVLVTSRSYQFAEKLKAEIQRPVDFINCSSSQIRANDKIIFEESIPNDVLAKILVKIEQNYNPIAFLMTTDEHSCIIKSNRNVSGIFMFFYRLWWKLQFVYREPFVWSNELFQKQLESGKILKIMNFIGLRKNKTKLSKELNKQFREEFPEIESSWTVKVIELTPRGCTKGNGVEKYCQIMNIDHNNVYVVGD